MDIQFFGACVYNENKGMIVIKRSFIDDKIQATIDRLVSEHLFRVSSNDSNVYLKKWFLTGDQLKDLFYSVEPTAVAEAVEPVTVAAAIDKSEQPASGLLFPSKYRNDSPVLGLSATIEKETPKAVCFKGVDGTLIWIPKAALKAHGKFYIVAKWFTFSNNKAIEYFRDYVYTV